MTTTHLLVNFDHKLFSFRGIRVAAFAADQQIKRGTLNRQVSRINAQEQVTQSDA